jgi:hypothetical protein
LGQPGQSAAGQGQGQGQGQRQEQVNGVTMTGSSSGPRAAALTK